MKKYFLIIFLLLPGCVSFYSTQSFELVAKETKSQLPATQFPVIIIYPYDNYGVPYILNAPRPKEFELGVDGTAVVKIAAFNSPHLVVGSTTFKLDEQVFKHEGTPFKFPYATTDQDYQKHREVYNAYKLPQKRYPEVDIELKKIEN